ncbi:hypothetical protein THIOSC15_1290023 [uncultured Thiomicrorhabdus sp.]
MSALSKKIKQNKNLALLRGCKRPLVRHITENLNKKWYHASTFV